MKRVDSQSNELAKQRRRNLRRRSTEAEDLLWSAIRGNRLDGRKFRRQHSIDRYIVDFVCLEAKVVIELDGEYHEHRVAEDLEREQHIMSHGFRILRLSNEDVMRDCEMACVAIRRFCDSESSTLRPSP